MLVDITVLIQVCVGYSGVAILTGTGFKKGLCGDIMFKIQFGVKIRISVTLESEKTLKKHL